MQSINGGPRGQARGAPSKVKHAGERQPRGASLLGGASTLADKWSKFMYTRTNGSPPGTYDASTGVNNGVMNGP